MISETTNEYAKQFELLEDEWNAIGRFPLPDGSWGDGPGSLRASKVLMAAFPWNSSRDLVKERPSRAAVSAAFNPQTSQWEHSWTATSAPGGFLVWCGRFEGGTIDVHGQWEDDTGHYVLSRLTWSRITEWPAHCESHRSIDGGKTCTKPWMIDFTRKTTK